MTTCRFAVQKGVSFSKGISISELNLGRTQNQARALFRVMFGDLCITLLCWNPMSHVVFCVGMFPGLEPAEAIRSLPTPAVTVGSPAASRGRPLSPAAALAVATAWTPAGGAWVTSATPPVRLVPPLHRGRLYAAVPAGVEEAAGDRPPRRRCPARYGPPCTGSTQRCVPTQAAGPARLRAAAGWPTAPRPG